LTYISYAVDLPPFTIHSLGDRSLTLTFEARMDPALHASILAIAAALEYHHRPGILDIVPAYHELAIHYDPATLRISANEHPHDFVNRWVEDSLRHVDNETGVITRTVEIPVCYDPSIAPDLTVVADQLGLSVADVIRIHSATSYHVYMIGFLPGFPYMGELPASLFMPRKAKPVMTTAGSVAIAGRQTGIYPMDSPGGWHVIGRTPVPMFTPEADPPVYLRPGDTVRFKPISRDVFDGH
jgi:inhibitor of KinA